MWDENVAGMAQPFGCTGDQSDRTARTYFAQAGEYKAEIGWFMAEDIGDTFKSADKDYSGLVPERTTYRYNAGSQLVALLDTEGGQTIREVVEKKQAI